MGAEMKSNYRIIHLTCQAVRGIYNG